MSIHMAVKVCLKCLGNMVELTQPTHEKEPIRARHMPCHRVDYKNMDMLVFVGVQAGKVGGVVGEVCACGVKKVCGMCGGGKGVGQRVGKGGRQVCGGVRDPS